MQHHVDGDLHDGATVSVTDRGFRYGDGAVETMRLYGGTVFNWDAHASRLATTCEQLGIDHGLDRAELHERVIETVTANDLTEAVVTLAITRGDHPTDVAPAPPEDPTVVIGADPAPPGGRDGARPRMPPATLQTVRTRRVPPAWGPGDDRTLSRLTAVRAHQELRAMTRDDPADEALLRDSDDAIAGGATSTVFFVTDAGLHTPATPAAPETVLRETVLDLARAEAIPVHEGAFDREALYTAAEAFLARTRWGLRPIGSVDGIDIGDGPVTALLRSRYDGVVESACY
ncbi:MAG: aminotransferase class IV [Halobacteriaceae archaeon]